MTDTGNPLQLQMVNLGCGTRIHPDWVNIDLNPAAPGVIQANFIAGIPLPDASASCVYHSHLLEHLPLDLAKRFLIECRRVLAPDGILRVVVPDFEQSARDYIAILDRRRAGDPDPQLGSAHRWLLIEMFDQMTRTRPGGEMVRMIREDSAGHSFIGPRLGAYGAPLLRSTDSTAPPNRFERLTGFLRRWMPRQWGRVLPEALFRQRGEIHQWMYDELFLGDMLRDAGYATPRRTSHLVSSIPGWSQYGLDAEPDGTQYKGTSLYMEAARGG